MSANADRAQGLAVLKSVEEKLKHYLPDPNLHTSNALTPTYKDFRMESGSKTTHRSAIACASPRSTTRGRRGRRRNT